VFNSLTVFSKYFIEMPTLNVRIILEPTDTPEIIKKKVAQAIKSYISVPIIGWKWEEVCPDNYAIIKVMY
jgi:hypothetical protein